MTPWRGQNEPGAYSARRGAPLLLVEQFAIAAWIRDGETVAMIARRLRRPIPEARDITFGKDA